jgi:hypothetical protein
MTKMPWNGAGQWIYDAEVFAQAQRLLVIASDPGNASRWKLSIAEDVGTARVLAPHVGKTVNPLVIHFG